jgi:hypothetical protein
VSPMQERGGRWTLFGPHLLAAQAADPCPTTSSNHVCLTVNPTRKRVLFMTDQAS